MHIYSVPYPGRAPVEGEKKEREKKKREKKEEGKGRV
jgi:hypothetical protein